MNSKESKPSLVKTEHKPDKRLFITIGSIIILVLAAISFIFLPALVQGSNPQEYKPLGYYKNKPIEYKQGTLFTTTMNYYLQQKDQAGEALDQSSYYQLLNQAFNTTVLRIAFAEAVQKCGYIVPESAVDRVMIQYFSDANGVYSPKVYNETSDSTKITLRKQIKDDLVYQVYYNDFYGEITSYMPNGQNLYGLKSSSAEIPFIFDMNTPAKTFDVVSFALSDYPKEELAAYGKNHADLFNTVNYSVITTGTEAEAKKIQRRIANNEITFSDAVSEYSNKNYSDQNGTLSSNIVYQLKKLLTTDGDLETLLSLGTGEISGVIKTGAFFSVFKNESAATAPDFSNLALLDKVYEYISANDAGIIEDYFMAKANDFASAASISNFANASNSSFDTACQKFTVAKQTTSAFPLNYGNNVLLSPVAQDIPVLSEASKNETFLKTAFALQENEVSAPIILNNNVLVLKLVSVQDYSTDLVNMLNYFYPAYAMSFDQSSAEQLIMSSKDVKNNVLNVFFDLMLASN